MTVVKDIYQTFKQLLANIEALAKHVESLPDNPRITRQSKQCFTISSKDIGNNWCPAYHDFAFQYRSLVAAMRANPLRSIAILQTAVTTQTLDTSRQRRMRLHPEVVQSIKTLLEQPQ